MIKNIKFLTIGLILLIVLIFFSVKIIQQFTKEEEIATGDFQSRINEFVNDGLNFKLGKTRDEIIKNLGEPLKLKQSEVKNIHNTEIIDTIYELFYDGLYIMIYKPKEGGFIEAIYFMSVTSEKYKMKWGLNIGASKKYVEKILGDPSREENYECTYISDNNEVGDDVVTFYFKNGFVNKIVWSYFFD